jgi:predicted transcriptional regulator of viral defense system
MSEAQKGGPKLALLGAIRPRDLRGVSNPSRYLARLEREGTVLGMARGLYAGAEAELTPHHSLAEAAKRVPRGVVCLLSALAFHELTDELPFEVWMAVPKGAWTPKGSSPPLRVVHVSGAALTEGVEVHTIEGVDVRIYAPAKTVADLFKFRSSVGLDVAVRALREVIRRRRAKPDELWRAAEVCRVSRVMRPYLEALV